MASSRVIATRTTRPKSPLNQEAVMKRHSVSCSLCVLCLSFMLSACSRGTPTPKTVAVAYVAHSQSHSISIINIPADDTVSTIEIGDASATTGTLTASYPQNVAVSPDGSRAYVTDGSTSVWVVDTQTRAVVATIPAGTSPEGVVISPNGKSVYVTTVACGSQPCVGAVAVIDATTNTVATTIAIGKVSPSPLAGIAISPDGTRVYVGTVDGNEVVAIDTATNSIAATIATSNSGLADVAISPDGSRVYAAGWVTGTYSSTYYVDVINTQTNAMSARVLLGYQETPVRIAVTPDGGHAYVIGDAGHMWVVDTTLNALFGSITVSAGNLLNGLAFTPDGTRVYGTCGKVNSIFVLDVGSSVVTGSVPSNYPGGLAIASAN
jgi:YVTN family beta-propeller protein